MTSINFILKTKPGMNLELLQVMGSVIMNFHNVEGCLNVAFKQDKLDKDQFYFRFDLQNIFFLKSLLNSNEFSLFEGTINVLCHNPIVEIIDNEERVLRITKENYKKEIQERILT